MADESKERPSPVFAKSIASQNPRESILNLLQQAGTSGTFATSGDCPAGMTMPGLFVDGIGMVGLPLSETTALALLEKCHTELNAGDVYRYKEMDSDGFSLQNPAWQKSIQALATHVCHDKLGVVPEVKVQAVVDKLVVLETETMFSHRDIQPGDVNDHTTTFGTLIVTLPSSFNGGKMVVTNHAGYHETVFSPDDEMQYKSRYLAFYNDCQLSECHPITNGHCLCLVFRLQVVQPKCNTSTPPPPPSLPCAASNNQFALLTQLRDVATAWHDHFDGNKLVIMTESNGNYKAIIHLLKLAVKEDVGLAWSRGSVNYRIYGYGMGRYPEESEWDSTEESKMTLNLCRRGLRLGDWDNEEDEDDDEEVEESDSDNNDDDDEMWGIYEDDLEDEFDADEDYNNGNATLDAAREMVPPDFYENIEPTEAFHDTYYGLKAKRNYEIQRAIVIWPKESNWLVLTKGKLDKMCQFLLQEPDGLRTDKLADQILAKEFKSYCDDGRRSVVSSFMQVLMAVGESDRAYSFWERYLAKQQKQRRLPNEILPQLGPFMEHFGNEDRVQMSLYGSIENDIIVLNPNTAIVFVSACVNSLKNGQQASLCQSLVEKLLASIEHLQFTVNDASAKAFLTMFETESGISDSAKIVSTFLDCISRSLNPLPSADSARLRSNVKKQEPVELLTAGLPKVCAVLGWQGVEESLTNVISKLIKCGHVEDALMLIKELSGPHPYQLDQDANQFKLCTALARRAVQPSLQATVEKPSMQALSNILFLADIYCPSEIDSIVWEIGMMDVDEIIAPLALAFRNQEKPSLKLQAAVAKLSTLCVEKLLTRISTPMEDAINWSLPCTADTNIDKQRINAFLCSPCNESLSFELKLSLHGEILNDLKPLVTSGHIEAYPSRPSGVRRWNIKIDKLQNHRQSVTSIVALSCLCWASDTRCIIASNKAKIAERQSDESILQELLSVAQSAEAPKCVQQRKRKQHTDEDVSTSSSGSKQNKRPMKSEQEVIVID